MCTDLIIMVLLVGGHIGVRALSGAFASIIHGSFGWGGGRQAIKSLSDLGSTATHTRRIREVKIQTSVMMILCAEPEYLSTSKFRASPPDVTIKVAARVPSKAHAELLTRTCKAIEHKVVQGATGTKELHLPKEDGKLHASSIRAVTRPDKSCTSASRLSSATKATRGS